MSNFEHKIKRNNGGAQRSLFERKKKEKLYPRE